MNGMDLLYGMQFVDSDYIERAEFAHFSREAFYREGKGTRIRKAFLLAAVVALTALLVGCGVVYVLRMQNLKLDQQEVVADRYDEEQATVVYETIQQQILTLGGLKGSPNYQAAKDWYEFMQAYDPDKEIRYSVDMQTVSFPRDYDIYKVYTQEMVDKIDEITAKYGLELMGKWVPRYDRRDVLEDFGIKTLLVPGTGATVNRGYSSSATEEGYFYADFTLNGDDSWPYAPLMSYYHIPKGHFSPSIVELDDRGDWQEQNYTTASGHQVLILRSPSDWRSYVFCDREDAVVYLRMETIWELYSDVEPTIRQPMTDAELKGILDCIDFSVTPQPYAPVAAEAGTAQGMRQTQNGYTLEVQSLFTDGRNARIIFGLTVPEGMELCKEDSTYSAVFGNFGNYSILAPAEEESLHWNAMGEGMIACEDNDGRDDTIQIIYDTYAWDDEKLRFEPGSLCKIRVRDISLERVEYPDGVYSGVVPLGTAEGVWEFDVVIPEDTDTRAIEFIGDPLTFPTSNSARGELRDMTLTSFKLRSLAPEITWKEEYAGRLSDNRSGTERNTQVVLKDGSIIPLDGGDYWIGHAYAPIPLDEVAYVELFNGIKLFPPK